MPAGNRKIQSSVLDWLHQLSWLFFIVLLSTNQFGLHLFLSVFGRSRCSGHSSRSHCHPIPPHWCPNRWCHHLRHCFHCAQFTLLQPIKYHPFGAKIGVAFFSATVPVVLSSCSPLVVASPHRCGLLVCCGLWIHLKSYFSCSGEPFLCC